MSRLTFQQEPCGRRKETCGVTETVTLRKSDVLILLSVCYFPFSLLRAMRIKGEKISRGERNGGLGDCVRG